jgi:hypothetical protein
LYSLSEARPRLWLVYSHEWYSDPYALIPQALDTSMIRTETHQFYGIQIMLYQHSP